MQEIIYSEPTVWPFLLLTVAIGGWTAWMTGRAVARSWQPYAFALAYFFPLAGAVRFMHFALAQGTLLDIHYYFVDLTFVVASGSIGYRFTRTWLMLRQYPWFFERSSVLTWRKRAVSRACAPGAADIVG